MLKRVPIMSYHLFGIKVSMHCTGSAMVSFVHYSRPQYTDGAMSVYGRRRALVLSLMLLSVAIVFHWRWYQSACLSTTLLALFFGSFLECILLPALLTGPSRPRSLSSFCLRTTWMTLSMAMSQVTRIQLLQSDARCLHVFTLIYS